MYIHIHIIIIPHINPKYIHLIEIEEFGFPANLELVKKPTGYHHTEKMVPLI